MTEEEAEYLVVGIIASLEPYLSGDKGITIEDREEFWGVLDKIKDKILKVANE